MAAEGARTFTKDGIACQGRSEMDCRQTPKSLLYREDGPAETPMPVSAYMTHEWCRKLQGVNPVRGFDL